MVDQAEGSQTDAQRGVQSTSANPAGFSGDDLMTLIRQSVQSILRESQLPTPSKSSQTGDRGVTMYIRTDTCVKMLRIIAA